MKSNLQDIWNNCLDILHKRTNRVLFESYISSSKLVSFEKNTAFIEVWDSFVKSRFESPSDDVTNSLYKEIVYALSEVTGKEYTLTFVIRDELFDSKKEIKEKFHSEEVFDGHLNSKFTFDNFIIGSSNKFAYAASSAVAETPGEKYNPLFLYGNSGLGKTHLLHAIGNEIKKNNPDMKVLYITTENFTNDFISSLQHKTNASFREKFRKVDVLLIDDIQFIAKALSTQEEFFNTFNTLHNDGKQIVITSDRPISDLSILEDRLKTRFSCGLVADIQTPDYETKFAIIERKAAENDISIENDIIDYIAISSGSSIREIEGVINHFSLSLSQGRDITMNLAREAIKHLHNNDVNEISVAVIIDVVSRYYGISVEDIMSKKRTRDITVARHISIFLCRSLTNLSFPEIGKAFNGIHHTSVMGAFESINDKISVNPELKASIDELKKTLSTNI
ncbi:MAG: chromosomal replication initiator protein DnaA [Ruminococcaceae bacterium]|nr:chromosomal replication initiator protein DnaA [Oscillospiraceae bacterium]